MMFDVGAPTRVIFKASTCIQTYLISVGIILLVTFMVCSKELKERPEKTYAEQENASFQNEDEYRHFGKYEEAYRKNIKAFEKMQDIKENIESASHRIYGNVLTLMGIIVAIFSLISINSRIFDGQTISPSYIIAMNLSLTFCIAVMLGMILFLINKGRGKGFAIIYGIVLLILGIASVIFCSKF